MTQELPTSAPLRLAYDADKFQFGDLYLPGESAAHGPLPVAILIHGGYWRNRYGLELLDGLAVSLTQRGVAAWNIEYRRVGDPGGGWPGTFLDVARAAEELKTLASAHNLDLSRVVAIGHSAGGHLAFWLAARPRVPVGSAIAPNAEPLALAGAISLAGVVDLHLAYQLHLSNDAVVELLGGTPDVAPERYAAASPAALLPLGVRQVVIHGDSDVNVPIEVSQSYVAAARAAGDRVTYLEPEGVDHWDVINAESAIWARTLQELVHLFG
jgi:acetyl esterase/lipase